MRFAGRPQSLFFLSLLAFAFVSAGSAHAQAPKLRVAYTAFAGTFTILWVGKDAGLYQKYGADLELLYIGSSTRAVQALLAGDIDIVYSAAGAVVDANLAGADLTMVGCQYDTGQSSFFTASSIASIGDLKGKAVGVSRFGAWAWAKPALTEANASKLRKNKLGARPANLIILSPHLSRRFR